MIAGRDAITGKDVLEKALTLTDLKTVVDDALAEQVAQEWDGMLDHLDLFRDKVTRLTKYPALSSADLFYSLGALVTCEKRMHEQVIAGKEPFGLITVSYALLTGFHLHLLWENFYSLRDCFKQELGGDDPNRATTKLRGQRGLFAKAAMNYIQDNNTPLAERLLEKASKTVQTLFLAEKYASSGQRKAHPLSYLTRARICAHTRNTDLVRLETAAADIEWFGEKLVKEEESLKSKKTNVALIGFDYASAACTLAKLSAAAKRPEWYQKSGALRRMARKDKPDIMNHPLFKNQYPVWQD